MLPLRFAQGIDPITVVLLRSSRSSRGLSHDTAADSSRAAPGDGAVAVAVVSAVAVALAVVTALTAERMLSGACPRSTAFSASLHGSRRAASDHSSQDNA